MKSRKKLYLRLASFVLAAYVAVGTVYYLAMLKPPASISKVMDKTPFPVFLLFPFRTMWNIARGGDLAAGDLAPDFVLPTEDGARVVKLSDFRGQKPVVLIFGSYT